MILFLVSFAVNGLNLGIDFTGGVEIQVMPNEEFEVEEVREVLGEAGLEGASVRTVRARETGEDEAAGGFLIRTAELPPEQRDALVESLEQKWPQMDNTIRSVGGVIGKEMTQSAIIAVVVALVAMVGYITYRFQFNYAVSTLSALMHDVIIVLGVFSLLQLEINEIFIAALLMVVGYSINDTIVIVDRIRENVKGGRKKDYPRVVNESVFQNLTRSINTSVTTLLVLIALLIGFTYFIGNMDLIVFVIALILGVLAGTYSSLFIASPMWLTLKQREFRKASDFDGG